LLVGLSLFLAYILCFRFDLLWCACTVCRELVGTLGSPCGSPHQVWFVLELEEGFYLLLVLFV
jgi:hypothetical protein